MMLRKRRAIHVSGNERVGIKRLFNRDAADERGHLARDFVEPAKHHVLAGTPYACALKKVKQARAGEPGRAYRAVAPLRPGHLGTVQATAVPGTFQSVDNR